MKFYLVTVSIYAVCVSVLTAVLIFQNYTLKMSKVKPALDASYLVDPDL